MPLTATAGAPVLGGTTQTFRQIRTLTAPFSPGRFGADAFKVNQRGAGANMSVDVTAGLALVKGTTLTGPTGQHKYWVPLTATANLGTITAPVSGTRVDAVILQVTDTTDVAGDVTNGGEVQYLVNGTVNGQPMDLSAKKNYLHLANVTVASGATSITTANIANVSPLVGLLIPGEDGSYYRLGVDISGDLGAEPTTY